uniref:Uncharacterized protein n=1 Tax=Manihot esculenta TaxID=3983 RepID=A0A2C9UW90_MANES
MAIFNLSSKSSSWSSPVFSFHGSSATCSACFCGHGWSWFVPYRNVNKP